MRPWILCLALAVSLAGAGCGGPNVDLTKALQVVDATTGWFDTGVVDGQNKLVPSITFKVKNVSDQTLSTLQANVIFRRMGEDTEWGSGYVRVTGSAGLAPGATSQAFTVNSQRGYTGTEPRAQMLSNSQFVDARVQIFAKYGSIQWVPITELTITRHLITK